MQGCSAECQNRIACELGEHAGAEYLPRNKGKKMSNLSSSEDAKTVVRRNAQEVQGEGRFDVFDELIADNFIDHTPQPNTTPDKAGVRKLYRYIRAAFPDFHAETHWQLTDGDRSQRTRCTTALTKGPFWASLQLTEKSSSRTTCAVSESVSSRKSSAIYSSTS